jgi:hypothetical protein
MSLLPTIPLGPHQVTRLIVGHNPICGLSHLSPELDCEMRDFYTPENVVALLHQCQAAGINTWLARGDYHRVLYWRELFRREGGELHWIAQTASEMHDVFENIRILAAAGAIGIYHHGTRTDQLWHAGEVDRVQDYLRCIRDEGLQVGLATHVPEVIEYAEEHGWDVDFYMACFYNLSVKPRESGLVTGQGSVQEEQYLPGDPERMCRTIRATDKTCLAFKILAAGRKCGTQEEVREAFRYAYANIKAKDAVVVGMFPKYEDQVALNVGYARELAGGG